MLIEILLLLFLLLLWAYYVVTKQFNYFKDKGVPFAKPSFPFGSSNMKKLILQRITFNKDISDLAEGELTKRVLIKDFDHFVDRRVLQEDSSTRANAIITGFLTNLKGDEWKAMRTMMTGVFTSGKLKLMTPHMVKVGQQLEDHIENILAGTISRDAKNGEDGGIIEIKSLGGMFTLDAIATTGFGIEWNALFPRLAKLLNISFFPGKPTEFFSDIIERTYRHRLGTGERRNDIIDLIVDELNASEKLKKKTSEESFESEFEKDAALERPEVGIDQKIDKELLLISNAMLFFFAGFDTTSTGLSIIAHNLTMHQDVQDKVADEIMTVLGDSDKIRFEDLQKLKYMDMVISECFRYNSLKNIWSWNIFLYAFQCCTFKNNIYSNRFLGVPQTLKAF